MLSHERRYSEKVAGLGPLSITVVLRVSRSILLVPQRAPLTEGKDNCSGIWPLESRNARKNEPHEKS